MTSPAPLRHARAVNGDRAMCGAERGAVGFGLSEVTCEACRADLIAQSERWHRELAAMVNRRMKRFGPKRKK